METSQRQTGAFPRPRHIARFFAWMVAFTLLTRGISGALLPVVYLTRPISMETADSAALTYCVPVRALHGDNGGTFLYVAEERATLLGLQNIVRKVYVQTAGQEGEMAVLQGYPGDSAVVLYATKSLLEGARVRVAQ